MASARPRNGGRWTAPSYLSAQAAKAKSRVDRGIDLGRVLPRRRPGQRRAADRRTRRPGRREVLGDVVEDLRPVVLAGRRPAGRLRAPPRRRCGCPCGCPRRPRRRACRRGRAIGARIAAVRPRLLAADIHLGGAVDAAAEKRRAPSSGFAGAACLGERLRRLHPRRLGVGERRPRARPRGRSRIPCSRRSRTRRRRGWSS